MAAPRSSPSPPPPQARSTGGGAHVSLFLDTDLGTHLALNVAADSTIRHLKSQVAVEHAAAFPDLGPVAVKSFQVLRKGAMYHLSDSMAVRSAFAKVKAGCFLHVKMAAVETDTHCCRDEDRGRSTEGCHGVDVYKRARELPTTISEIASDVLPQRLEGGEDAVVLNNIHAHYAVPNDVLLSSSSQKNAERKNNEAPPIRETNDSETRDVNESNRVPLETNTSSRGVLSGTSFQQEVHGNVQGDSIQLENSIVAGKSKKKKRRQPVTSKDVVSSQEVTKSLTRGVEVPKAISEDLLHEDSQGLQGDGAYNVEMTSRDKAVVRPSDMLLSSSQLNSGSQGTKHVQLLSDAHITNDLVAGQINVDLVNKGYRSPAIEGTSKSTSKVVTGEEKSTKGTNDGCHDESAVEASNMEKGSESKTVLETIHTASNTSQEKNCKKAKKITSVRIASMDTAEEKDQCGYGEKAAESDIVYTQGEIVNDPYKRQISSNVQQGDSNVIENPNGDGKRKKKRRRHSESSNDEPTQDTRKSSGFITNGNSTQTSSAHPLDAKQTTLGTIGEATVEEKDQCEHGEKTAKPVIVSTQGEIVNDPSNVQQADCNVIANPNGDRKRKKKRRHHSESLNYDPTQDVTKSSIQNTSADPLDAKQATPGTIEDATVSDCKMLDESLGAAATNVIDEVLADLRCTDSLSKGLDGDPLTEQIQLGSKSSVGAALPPKYPAAIHSDAPISLPSHKKSKGKQLKVLSTVIDSSHSSDDVPEENVNTELRESDSLRCSDKISDLKDVLTKNTVGQADDRTKATKHQRRKISLKHVPADSGKAIQSSGEQVSQVAAEVLKGANATKAELVQGGSVIDVSASTVRKLQHKSKRSSKTQTPKIQEINHFTHVQDTALEHDTDADLMNSRVQQETVSPKSSAHAVEPNTYVAVHPDNDKINFIDHFNPSGTNGPSDSAENNEDETIREVKGKKRSKRKQDMHSQRAGSIEPYDLLESHPHTDKTSSTDHFGTGNVGVPSVSAENINREDGNVKKVKEKRRNKRKLDLVKPESENPNVDHQDTDNCSQNLLYSVVHKGKMEQDNGKENNNKIIQNNSMLQQETEGATCDSTLEKKHDQSMFDADSQNNLPINKDHACVSREQSNTTSQIKHHAKSRNHDGSINGRTGPNPKAVSNLVKSFCMSPPASSESLEGTPQNANRYRVAVRKVPRKRYEQVSDKSKKDSSKRATGAIFNDAAISEGSDDVLNTMSKKAAMETSSDDSSTSADSGGNLNEIISHGIGISSAAQDGSDLPDDDGVVSLSQRSLKEGLHIGSILRGSSSYMKARLKQTEQLDDTEVPDSQPADDL